MIMIIIMTATMIMKKMQTRGIVAGQWCRSRPVASTMWQASSNMAEWQQHGKHAAMLQAGGNFIEQAGNDAAGGHFDIHW